MLWNRYFLPSFILLLIIAGLHWLGTENFYYWGVWWYDFMMHFLGGAWVALATLWVSEMSFAGFVRTRLSVRSIILGAFAVGVAWEIYELAFQITYFFAQGYAFDTGHDITMDIVGATFVAYLWKRFIKTSHK